MKLTFYGGAKSVTGANYLLESGDLKMLIDCGLLQGSKFAEEFNYSNFGYNPKEIDFVFITHSHADHIGRLPKLLKDGFRGKIFMTNATLDMAKKALPDNLNLIKEEARKDGHNPLFSLEDLNQTLSAAQGIDYGEVIDLGENTKVRFLDAGHILGSAIIEISSAGEVLYFSGDLGNPPTPLLNNPFYPVSGNYLVIESAYGSRIHEDRSQRREILTDTIIKTIKNGGTVIIPSFAIERTQELLYELDGLIKENKIPKIPIFVDSPLATRMTEVYEKYPDYFNKEVKYIINSGEDVFKFPGVSFTITANESKSINDITGPKIIIAGSGMSQGGRILYHEIRYLPDPKSTILIVGYQVEGSLGRKILDGAKEIKIFGENVPVNCLVKAIGGYSSHADQEMLLKWVGSAVKGGELKKVFVVQGEEDAASILAGKIKENFGVEGVVPDINESFEI